MMTDIGFASTIIRPTQLFYVHPFISMDMKCFQSWNSDGRKHAIYQLTSIAKHIHLDRHVNKIDTTIGSREFLILHRSSFNPVRTLNIQHLA